MLLLSVHSSNMFSNLKGKQEIAIKAHLRDIGRLKVFVHSQTQPDSEMTRMAQIEWTTKFVIRVISLDRIHVIKLKCYQCGVTALNNTCFSVTQ